MKCGSARQRFELAKKWFTKIQESYDDNDEIIESYTEYFLIISRSIQGYIINDFLEILDKKIPMNKRADIIQHTKKYREGTKSISHKEDQKIVAFLKFHNDRIEEFEKDLLIQYFIALRNWTVHTIFPHIYENQHGDNDKILHRRFQRNFVNYLDLEKGGHLLLNTGYSLLLENSDENSIFDKYPLTELKPDKKQELVKKLEETEAITLLENYLKNLDDLIRYFEENFDKKKLVREK